MYHIPTIEGQLVSKGLKIAIVAARFNDFIVDRLIGGAVDFYSRHTGDKNDLTIIRTPGAFEVPLVCQKAAQSGKYVGILALGAVIRGATPHFDFVANEATKGCAHVSLATGVPIGFGILTTDTIEQAIERAGSKAGNKGAESCAALIETIRVLEQC